MSINLIITSAWNPKIPQAPQKLVERRKRLLASIGFYYEAKIFNRIILIDSTIDENAIYEILSKFPIEIPKLSTHPDGTYEGPSYLEALLWQSVGFDLFEKGNDKNHYFKISGGYIVKNIKRIVDLYRSHKLEALGYVHQNPLRLQPKFVMTACMAMSSHNCSLFLDALIMNLYKLRKRNYPLEFVYREFLENIGSSPGLSMPYPRLQASFATYGKTNNSIGYKMREIFWIIYSRIGIFVLSNK